MSDVEMKAFRSKELYGDFYRNEGKPLVVVIGGSRPGLPPMNDEMKDYLLERYQVLLMAYFGVGELPETLERIPMEYFINAINKVKEMAHVSDDQLIMIGQSKGGECVLKLTQYIKSAATIACVGSCYVFQGLSKATDHFRKSAPQSSWTYEGKDLPFLPFKFDLLCLIEVMRKKYCRCYERAIKKNRCPEAEIRIEDYRGKILLLSEENDPYWPSKEMSSHMAEQAADSNKVQHISLTLEGHRLLTYEASVNEVIRFLDQLELRI